MTSSTVDIFSIPLKHHLLLPPTIIVVDFDEKIDVDCRFHGVPVPMVTMEGDAITDNLLTFSASDLGRDDDCYYGVSSTLQWGPETPRRNAGGIIECLGQNEVDPEPVTSNILS